MADIDKLTEMLNCCTLCPRNCKVNRNEGQIGYCRIGKQVRIASVEPHFGEEAVLVGAGGSGTIFFCGCNLHCIFCQNAAISQERIGRDITIEKLSQIMLKLQTKGVSNINLVSPSHVAAQIARAIDIARNNGLNLPIVYNTGGYDSVETLQAMEGLIDIYMPDMKFSESKISSELCDAADYPQINQAAVKEMHRQVGDLQIESGLATKGLLVRHLVLPYEMAGSFKIIDFLAKVISKNTTINIMAQYRPCHLADKCPPINRYPTEKEISTVTKYARKKGLNVLE